MLVVVFGEKNVRQVFNDKEFDARPHNFFSRLRCLGNKNMGKRDKENDCFKKKEIIPDDF